LQGCERCREFSWKARQGRKWHPEFSEWHVQGCEWRSAFSEVCRQGCTVRAGFSERGLRWAETVHQIPAQDFGLPERWDFWQTGGKIRPAEARGVGFFRAGFS
jgi:hypothetical protein